MIQTEPSYTCIRECYYQNKHFKQGEPFPENWFTAGVPVGKHFAKTNEAGEIIKIGKLKSQQMTAGDDPRSNDELKAILSKAGIEAESTWTRSQLWAAAIEHENKNPTLARKEK
jgi:hypothetical protein